MSSKKVLKESFSWTTGIPELSTIPTDRKVVRIRGIAGHVGAVSKNGRKYVEEELRASARTWVKKPLTINHSDYSNPKNHVGEVVDMELDTDGNLEYIADVWKQPYVDMIRSKSTSIVGVSIEAEYKAAECWRCQKRFPTEEAYFKHLTEDHFFKDVDRTVKPYGIMGKALSIVLTPQIPGIEGTNVQLMEQTDGFLSLMETFLQDQHPELEEKGFALGPSTAVKTAMSPIGLAKPKTKEYHITLIGREFHVVEGTQIVKSFEKRIQAENHIQKLEAEELGLTERIEKRGNQFCIVHCHPPNEGEIIKCFPTREEAESMHAAMMAGKESVKTEPAKTEKEKIEENLAFLGNHADLKVKEAVDYLLSVMDRRAEDLIQRAEDAEKKVGLTETVKEARAFKETVDSQKERILKLEEEMTGLKGEVSKRDSLVEENKKLQIENDNIRDKVRGQFKGRSTVKREPDQHPVDPVTGRM
jgi:hypothetical protein